MSPLLLKNFNCHLEFRFKHLIFYATPLEGSDLKEEILPCLGNFYIFQYMSNRFLFDTNGAKYLLVVGKFFEAPKVLLLSFNWFWF